MLDDTFTSPGQVAILATTIAALITTIATLVYNFKREGRRHQWEVEAAERHRLADKVAKVEREALAAKVEEAKVALNAKIDENTEISKLAFTEANHINEKIAAQGEAFDALLRTALAAAEDADDRVASKVVEAAARVAAKTAETVAADHAAISDVAETTSDTQRKVTDIHKRIVDDA